MNTYELSPATRKDFQRVLYNLISRWECAPDDERGDWTIEIQDFTDKYPTFRQEARDAGVAGIAQ